MGGSILDSSSTNSYNIVVFKFSRAASKVGAVTKEKDLMGTEDPGPYVRAIVIQSYMTWQITVFPCLVHMQ